MIINITDFGNPF
uniref:Uncharacterized protein n=1 Tax=Lepeophtheirus salmonis TaxID=72036 RepID=A0A0K2U6A0_LEPSM